MREFIGMMRILLLVLAAIPALAGGLNRNLVPANARWVLHLDGEAFRKTKFGAAFVDEKLESHVRKAEADAKTDFSFSFKTITALTAFGTKVGEGDHEGVLVMQTPADLKTDLSKLIAIKELGSSGEPPISKLADTEGDVYLWGKEIYLMSGAHNCWLIGKHKPSLEAARKVVAGAAPGLTKADFLDFPAAENGFFLLAAADTGSAGARLPAQAKILQNAEAGRIVIGEAADKLFLNLSLKAKDADTLSQIGEVLRGLKALVALANTEDKDLKELVNSAAISQGGNILTLNLNFPVRRAIEKSREED
jgi:hypothetical protein